MLSADYIRGHEYQLYIGILLVNAKTYYLFRAKNEIFSTIILNVVKLTKHNIHTRHGKHRNDYNKIVLDKVITTMVVRPLDDCTYCARSAIHSIWILAKAVRSFMASLYSQPINMPSNVLY